MTILRNAFDTFSSAGIERLRTASVAFMLGALLVVGVGFAPAQQVHNAAHDGRHVAAFPCH